MSFSQLNEKIVTCRMCPRLVAFREGVPPRASFRDELYWRRPVPGFGDPKAWLLILGLAPSAHGGNRTGRPFTGDESGRFLMEGLHAAGIASLPTSESRSDGLTLKGCYITAAVKCVPPGNRPHQEEFATCHPYFETEFYLLKKLRAVLALGQWGWNTYLHFLKRRGLEVSGRFTHGAKYSPPGWPTLYGSFHPSPQNTYTKKLTKEMFVSVLETIQKEFG